MGSDRAVGRHGILNQRLFSALPMFLRRKLAHRLPSGG
jgi:hypothetical protein